MKKSIIITSLKGGTGKSFTSATFAMYEREKKPVVLIDADVDSPNLAEIIKAPEIKINIDTVEPSHLDGIDFFSVGALPQMKDRAISMSGDAYVQILIDFLKNSKFKVDVNESLTIIDLPAGSSNVMRGICRAFADSIVGSLIVINPDCPNDLKRIITILRHFGIPIIGVLCNKAYFECEHGKKYEVFGSSEKVRDICNDEEVDLLAEIPVSLEVREVIDSGIPYVPENLIPVFDEIHSRIETLKPATKSILSKIGEKIEDKLKKSIAKIIANVIIKINKDISIKKINDAGFGGKILEVVITDKGEEVTKVYTKLSDDKLLVLRTPKKVDITVILSIDTLVRLIRGKEEVDDAVLFGDIEIYGDTGSVRAMNFLEVLWGEMRGEIKESLGGIV